MLIWARQPFAKGSLSLVVNEVDYYPAVGKLECRFNRVSQPRNDVFFYDEPVNNNRNVMLEALFQWLGLGEHHRLTINHSSGIALRLKRCKKVMKLTFFLLNDWCQQLEPGSIRKCQQLVDNCLRGLLGDNLAANMAVWNSNSRPE